VLKAAHGDARHPSSPLPIPAKTADHSIDMNKVVPLLVFVLLSACAPSHWEKAGADLVTTERDQAGCRKTADMAVQRTFSQPPPGAWAGSETWTPYTGMRAGSGNMWQTTPFQGEDRVAAESRINYWCMRKRGYERVPSTPPPPASASAPGD
jgi:hypothetical protein